MKKLLLNPCLASSIKWNCWPNLQLVNVSSILAKGMGEE
jgi:hypothetical protein